MKSITCDISHIVQLEAEEHKWFYEVSEAWIVQVLMQK